MKILFLFLGIITLAILANASPTADDAPTDKEHDDDSRITKITKQLCAKLCQQLKPQSAASIWDNPIMEKLRQLRDKILEKCHC